MIQPTEPLALEQSLFAGLGADERTLFESVHQTQAGCKVLRYLYDNPNVRLSAEDIAFQVKESLPVVQGSLQQLIKLELAARVSIEPWEFFGLVVEPERRRQVRSLFAWQKRWHARLERIGRVVNGEPRT